LFSLAVRFELRGSNFAVRCSGFGVRRSLFGVQGSMFGFCDFDDLACWHKLLASGAVCPDFGLK